MSDYILVFNNNVVDFIREVNEYLNKGYKPCGFQLCDNTQSSHSFRYNQAMYFEGVEEKKEEPTENKQGSCQNCGNGPFMSSTCMKKLCIPSDPTYPYYLANYVPKTTEKKRQKYIFLEVGDDIVIGKTEYYDLRTEEWRLCNARYPITKDEVNYHRQAVED